MDLDDQSSRLHFAYSGIDACDDVASALAIFQRSYRIDHVTYHLSQTTASLVDAPFVRTTYNEAWVARYLLRGYVSVDPIVAEGFLRQLPFDWRDVEATEATQEFLLDAAGHGIGRNGFSIPVADKSRRALLSLNSSASDEEWSDIIADARDEWIDLARLIHRKAIFEVFGRHDPVPLLSPREMECLHWLALGNDYKGVGLILGLSEHTIRSYLKSARYKLGCLTTTAATARAIQLRLINPYGNTPI
ncbi:LuxR family transcriptional regulator [Agrobacterium pusense]|uniref:LuxR family transcriptional regulator n=2 Tax=Agrobacterium TaxID=357 RepID=UPI000DC0404B|nr:LuxR family transcriptional regulator [Agrobacterium sp. MS2]